MGNTGKELKLLLELIVTIMLLMKFPLYTVYYDLLYKPYSRENMISHETN